MEKATLLLVQLSFTICYSTASSVRDAQRHSCDKQNRHSGILGYVEYLKSGQAQGDVLLVVLEGDFAVRLGNKALIKQKVKVSKGRFYSITFSAARTCAQEEKLNVSISPNSEEDDDGIIPMQTLYSSSGWDSYAWGFQAEAEEVEISIDNPGMAVDPACGPLIESVALKVLHLPKGTGGAQSISFMRSNRSSPFFLIRQLVEEWRFRGRPIYYLEDVVGVLVLPHIEDDHSPLPGWIVESLRAVKYVDSEHFLVPIGKRAAELIAGKESALAQVVRTKPGRVYVLSFAVGDAKNSCVGPLAVEAYARKESTKVSYTSKGRGGFVHTELSPPAQGSCSSARSTRRRVTARAPSVDP
ncbi:hypothetical protein CRG98_024781 [Punica granatum]|uniref:DUF642 domain-containing protein n=1 Tax=Punica granatum TaxID=22663 RepID=A0A2I0JG10_PUNGR|nr:hypothetical protein CRG98_024781 [Punica granatum]